MTPNELRALADCLDDPNAMQRTARRKAADYLRAQADAQPMAWRDHVEQRIRGWRQRTMNRSGDRLALDDMMGQDTIDDLIDYVCDEWSYPAPAAPQAEPKREPLSEATALIEWPESAKWKNRAAPEGIERSCMGEPKREPTCLWSRADDDTDMWETKCGHAFTIIDGTPTDNQMAFCCYCGRRVDEEIGGSDE